MKFKSQALKTIMNGRKMIKFSKDGEYETSDKDEIKAIKGAVGVEEVKTSKE